MGGSAENNMASIRNDSITASGSSGELTSRPTAYNDTWPLQQNSSESPEMMALYVALHGVIMPVISAVGVVTNLVNIVVLSSVIKRSRAPLYHILLAMAVADFLLMGVVLLYCARFYIRERPIATKEDVDGVDWPSYFFFHTWETFANVCGMASNWCVLAITTFRFIAVYFPLHAHIWCTRQRARIVIVCIFAASIVMNVPYALVVELNLSTGQLVLQADVNEAYKSTYYVVLLIVYHVIPWLACIVLVALLQLGLWSQQRLARACSAQEKQRIIEQKKLSVTFIGVALWFIVCTTPKAIYQFITYAYDEASMFTYRPSVQCFFAATQAVLLLNYAANFFMYAFINHTYRKKLIMILCCRKTSTIVIHNMVWAIRASNDVNTPDFGNGVSATDERRTVPKLQIVSHR